MSGGFSHLIRVAGSKFREGFLRKQVHMTFLALLQCSNRFPLFALRLCGEVGDVVNVRYTPSPQTRATTAVDTPETASLHFFVHLTSLPTAIGGNADPL